MASGNRKPWIEIVTAIATVVGAVGAIAAAFPGLVSKPTPSPSGSVNITVTGGDQTQTGGNQTQQVEENLNQPSEKRFVQPPAQQPKPQIQFYCNTSERDGKSIPTTFAKSPSRSEPLAIIYWKPDNFYFGKNWLPPKRCEEVSKRFQTIYNRDTLKYITADVAQWISNREIYVICSVKEQGTRCEEDDLLLTLETKDDPNKVLGDLIALRQTPSTNKPLERWETKPKPFTEGRRVWYDLLSELEVSQQEDSSDEVPAF